jgi:hypothetical protein
MPGAGERALWGEGGALYPGDSQNFIRKIESCAARQCMAPQRLSNEPAGTVAWAPCKRLPLLAVSVGCG